MVKVTWFEERPVSLGPSNSLSYSTVWPFVWPHFSTLFVLLVEMHVPDSPFFMYVIISSCITEGKFVCYGLTQRSPTSD